MNKLTLNHLYNLVRPHHSITSPAERRKVELIASLSLVSGVLDVIFILVMILLGFLTNVLIGLFVICIASFITYGVSRSPRHIYAVPIFLLGLSLAVYIVSWSTGSLVISIFAFLFLFLLSNLADLRVMLALIAINAIIAIFTVIQLSPVAIETLTATIGLVALALFTLLFAWHRNNLERLRLGEVLQAQAALEERNRALQIAQEEVRERLTELQLAAEVGRAVSQVRRLDEMLTDAVERIRARFDLYYTQVYLINLARTHLVLEAGTGEAGKTLLSRRHQLPLDRNSLNGRAALDKTPVVVPDTAQNPAFKPNPLLPDTRSEMAVPLIVGETVIGVLDMQSRQPGALSEQALPAFEALAGQLAIAIQNARLLQEAEQSRAEVEKQARRLTRAYWQEYLDSLHRPEQFGYVYQDNQVAPLEDAAALQTAPNAIRVPLQVTGEQLGALIVEVDEETSNPQVTEIASAVSRQLAEHLEALRLLETAERYRIEAEEAARRLTRAGWEEYLRAKAGQPLSYLYDQREVKPIPSASALTDQTTLTVPIQVSGETIGKLAVLDLETSDPETLELVNTIAGRLSEHLENLRLLEETQRSQVELDKRAQRLAAISEITTISSRETDINRMLETVVHLTQRKFELYHAHVFTYNQTAHQLEIIACGWQEGDEHEGTHGTTAIAIDAEQSLVARAARTRAPVVVNDVRNEPGWLPNPLLPETRAELAVPLLIGEEVLGVLDVQANHTNAFSEEDVNIQMTLAAQVATALQNARNYARARKQAEREALLNAISQKIQSATSVEAVLQIAARELGRALAAPRAIAQLNLKDS